METVKINKNPVNIIMPTPGTLSKLSPKLTIPNIKIDKKTPIIEP